MSKKLMFAFLLSALSPVMALADSNLHTISGTLTNCSCQYFPTTSDWICWGSFQIAAPYPHFSASNQATVSVELVEQAIGQCGSMQPTLPKPVQALFWLEAAGIDYVHGVVRSPAKSYYLVDLGQ